ncbi:hypothetical protein Pelo_3071 [Pelomyxa schiedti]|nr:hypothetical protein Pelo_3071 [Pelomyxa schiedti]
MSSPGRGLSTASGCPVVVDGEATASRRRCRSSGKSADHVDLSCPVTFSSTPPRPLEAEIDAKIESWKRKREELSRTGEITAWYAASRHIVRLYLQKNTVENVLAELKNAHDTLSMDKRSPNHLLFKAKTALVKFYYNISCAKLKMLNSCTLDAIALSGHLKVAKTLLTEALAIGKKASVSVIKLQKYTQLLGSICRDLGETTTAVSHFKMALSMSPEQAPLSLTVCTAQCMLQLGRLDEVESVLSHALSAPVIEASLDCINLYKLNCILHLKKQQIKLALSDIQSARDMAISIKKKKFADKKLVTVIQNVAAFAENLSKIDTDSTARSISKSLDSVSHLSKDVRLALREVLAHLMSGSSSLASKFAESLAADYEAQGMTREAEEAYERAWRDHGSKLTAERKWEFCSNWAYVLSRIDRALSTNKYQEAYGYAMETGHKNLIQQAKENLAVQLGHAPPDLEAETSPEDSHQDSHPSVPTTLTTTTCASKQASSERKRKVAALAQKKSAKRSRENAVDGSIFDCDGELLPCYTDTFVVNDLGSTGDINDL